jgi:aspartate aminotransferase-like enzyme
VTTVDNKAGLDVSALNKFLLVHEMRIANGYGALKGKTFRIAHMGETQMADIERLLTVFDQYLARQLDQAA